MNKTPYEYDFEDRYPYDAYESINMRRYEDAMSELYGDERRYTGDVESAVRAEMGFFDEPFDGTGYLD